LYSHKGRPIRSLMLCVIILLSFLYLSFAMHGGEAATGLSEDASSDLLMTSHRATLDDILRMKSMYGTRAESDPNESVTVDGFGTGLAPHTEEEWTQLVGRLSMFDVESLPDNLPTTIDLSTDPAFPAVGNQASQGSCSAWAATYYSYGYLEAVDNGWTGASLGDPEQLMSPAWTYNMVNGGKDRGSWTDTNMLVIVDWGVPTMATMPYDEDDYRSWGSPEAFREAPLHRAYEVGYLEYSEATTVEAIKALVSAGTPVVFAMDADELMSAFSDGNYIISSNEYSSTALNHAQTVVGYDDTLSDDSDTGAFRVVNSWGASWGDSGYYWFTYAAIEELGDLGILALNFIVDVQDYQPSLLGVWHFDAAPARTSSISVSVGVTPGEQDTKLPYFEGGLMTTKEVFPKFMCLDITELSATFWSEGGMHLSIGDSRIDGVISSFRVESYEPTFSPGRASQVSPQSADVPTDTPGSVSAYLDYYAPMSFEAALEVDDTSFSSSGQACWTPVDHHSSGDGDSMQAGDISDDASSRMESLLEGPSQVTFDWRVSAQGSDTLSFYIDDVLSRSIAGDTEWDTVSVSVGEGQHTLAWVYEKDGYASMLEDSGWVDSVSFRDPVPEPNEIPEIVLVSMLPETDYVLPGETVTFALDVQDSEGGQISVVASYGDGSPDDIELFESVQAGEVIRLEFLHEFSDGSDTAYEFAMTAADDVEHPGEDWNAVSGSVLVNTPPTAAVSADRLLAEVGVSVQFDASTSSDPETDSANLQYRWDWTGDGTFETDWSTVPDAIYAFEAPGVYEVAVEVKDGAGLVSTASVTVMVTGEAIPEFSGVLVPLACLLVVLAIVRTLRRR
jgi:C1A family cysteine protease